MFGLHASDPKKYPKGSGNFTIKADQTVTFRYRAVFHTGDCPTGVSSRCRKIP